MIECEQMRVGMGVLAARRRTRVGRMVVAAYLIHLPSQRILIEPRTTRHARAVACRGRWRRHRLLARHIGRHPAPTNATALHEPGFY